MELQFDPDPAQLLITVIRASPISRLATYAAQRHGYENSDVGCGITYPSDLDEHDRVVLGSSIPAGFIHVYANWGPPDGPELVVPEHLYLTTLADELERAGLSLDAESVRAITVV